MKAFYKTYLLPVLMCLVLFSCGEDEKDESIPAIDDQLKGTWVKSLIRLQYYDASGKMDFEDQVTEENGELYEFDASTLTATDNDDNSVETISYTIINKDGGNFIILSDGTDEIEYKVISITEDKLIWQSEYEYLDYFNPTRKTAEKAIYVEEFNKQD